MTLLPADLPCSPDRLDGLASWAELLDLLHDDWLSVRDGRDRWLLRVRHGLGLVEHPGLLNARERRGLHRSGFRLQHADDLRVWVWVLPEDPPPDPGDVPGLLRVWQERDDAVRDQALRTVRGVLRAELAEVSVLLLPEPDEHDDRAGRW